MDILTGKLKPAGNLPFALTGNARPIMQQDSDAPGYDEADTLLLFGHGQGY